MEQRVTEQPVESMFVDSRAAEKVTSLSRWTLGRHASAGRLRRYKIGGAVRYRVADLIEFMEGHEAE